MPRRLLLLVLTLPLLGLPAQLSLARFTDAAAPTGSFASDTLDPPTSLSASGGTSVTLTWSVTPDTYAAGYNVYRATASGGPYSLVKTVTPRSATTTTDSPGNGTYYYRLRAEFQSWESVDSNTANAVVSTQMSTAYAACVSQAADTTNAGDNNGYQGNPTRACVDDSSFATDTNSGTNTNASCGSGAVPDTGKDRHRFWGFTTGLPASVTSIDGIQVRADLAQNNTNGTTSVCAQLSWDGGTTWTTLKSVSLTATAETTFVFGSTSDTWGRTWTPTQLNTTNFRVRLVDAATVTNKQFQLDYLAVRITYTP